VIPEEQTYLVVTEIGMPRKMRSRIFKSLHDQFHRIECEAAAEAKEETAKKNRYAAITGTLKRAELDDLVLRSLSACGVTLEQLESELRNMKDADSIAAANPVTRLAGNLKRLKQERMRREDLSNNNHGAERPLGRQAPRAWGRFPNSQSSPI